MWYWEIIGGYFIMILKNRFILLKILIIAPTFCMFLSACRKNGNISQIVSNIESVTIYDLEGLKADTYLSKDLQAATKVALDVDVFKKFLSSVIHLMS